MSSDSDDFDMSEVSVEVKKKQPAKPATKGKKTVEEEYKKMDPRFVQTNFVRD